jgi:co-chaperonin GroES (HSP10)
VLVKVAQEETKTRGGILLPVSAIKKPTSGELAADAAGAALETLAGADGGIGQFGARSRHAGTGKHAWAHLVRAAGDVVEVGDGRSMDGTTRDFFLKTGDTVSTGPSGFRRGEGFVHVAGRPTTSCALSTAATQQQMGTLQPNRTLQQGRRSTSIQPDHAPACPLVLPSLSHPLPHPLPPSTPAIPSLPLG